MADYRFVTDLRIRASIDDVYLTLVEPERWLDAWPDVVRVARVRDGDGDGLGAAFEAAVRAPLGYRLRATITTVAADRPDWLRMTASGGLGGEARWHLSTTDGTTAVRFAWHVDRTPAWLDTLTPVARPVFERSHHVVVRHAAEAAAASLDAELLAVRSRAVRP